MRGRPRKVGQDFLCKFLEKCFFFFFFCVDFNQTWLKHSLAKTTVQMLPFPFLLPGEKKRSCSWYVFQCFCPTCTSVTAVLVVRGAWANPARGQTSLFAGVELSCLLWWLQGKTLGKRRACLHYCTVIQSISIDQASTKRFEICLPPISVGRENLFAYYSF